MKTYGLTLTPIERIFITLYKVLLYDVQRKPEMADQTASGGLGGATHISVQSPYAITWNFLSFYLCNVI